MAKYQSYTQVPGFAPRSVVDTAGQVRAQEAKRLDQVQKFFNSRRVTDQQAIEDTRFVGQDLEALASFSKTLNEYVAEVGKQTAKDKQTGDMWNTIMNPEFRSDQFEQPFIEAGNAQNAVVGAAANELEAAGEPLTAEELRKQYKGIGEGLTNERAQAQILKTKFPTLLTARVNSDELVKYNGKMVPLSSLFGSGDADKVDYALSYAATRILEENNAQFFTKDTLVEYLGETVPATIGYMGTNQLSQTIKQQKDERLAETKTTGYNLGVTSTSDNATQNFQTLSKQLYDSNNGIVTMGGANRTAATVLFNGAASVSLDQLRIVAGGLQVPGNLGTTLKSTYPVEYAKAKELAIATENKNNKVFFDKLKDDTMKSVQGMQSMDEKLAEIEDAAEKLEERNMYTEAYELRQAAGKYVAPPQAMATFLKLQDKQAKGQAVTESQIGQLLRDDQLTPDLAQKLRTQRGQVFKDSIDAGKDARQINVAQWTGRIRGQIEGSYNPVTGDWEGVNVNSPITRNQLRGITKAYEKDLQAHLNRVALTIDPTLPESEKVKQMNEAAKSFYQEQVIDPNGKYYLGGLLDAERAKVIDDSSPEHANIRNAANQFNAAGSVAPPAKITPGRTDYSDRWNPGMGITPEIKDEYERGDRLYSPAEAVGIKNNAERGILTIDLIQAARSLGLTPREFADQQVAASSLEPINWNAARTATTSNIYDQNPELINIGSKKQGASDPNQREPGKQGYRIDAAITISKLLGAGYSVQGSSTLAAYFYLLEVNRAAKGEELVGYFQKDTAVTYMEGVANAKLWFGNPVMSYRNLTNELAKSPFAKQYGITAADIMNYAKLLEQLYGLQ